MKFDLVHIWGISSSEAWTVYDYGMDPAYFGRGVVVKPWNKLNPHTVTPSLSSSFSGSSTSMRAASFSIDGVLMTDEMIRMKVLLPLMLQSNRPILLVGPQGSGKSTIVSHVVQNLSNKG